MGIAVVETKNYSSYIGLKLVIIKGCLINDNFWVIKMLISSYDFNAFRFKRISKSFLTNDENFANVWVFALQVFRGRSCGCVYVLILNITIAHTGHFSSIVGW